LILGMLCVPVLAALLALTATPQRVNPGVTFRDCAGCGLMRVLPAGRFVMGSPLEEIGRQAGEMPQHAVAVKRPFAIGVHDVTRAEYARFVSATGYAGKKTRCDWRNPKLRGAPFKQTPSDPVVCVNWTDAQAYLRWLSRKSGHAYRLPTEVEWEYAARAGSITARPWGPNADRDRANTGADTCCGPQTGGRDRWRYTSPVGSFAPNAFGLFDMIGNVWQWTADCGDAACGEHAVRGGGWFHSAMMARSASRAVDRADRRATDIGFRVARSLD
jgi:formylglycine-generating enzyme required for sulfatase activity